MTAVGASITPVRLGIIGAAADRGWARAAHIPAIASVAALNLHAVATTLQDSADAAAAAFGAALAFGDPHAMIDHPDVEAIAVVVKAPAHFDLVHHALMVGKPVYCEWPLGKSFAETEELAKLAVERGVLTAIGLQGRFSPWLIRLRDVVAGGQVGRVLSTSMLAYDEISNGSVDAGNAYMLDVDNGANPLTIHGGHFIDALCFVLGEISEVAAITATTRGSVAIRETGAVVPTNSPDQIAVAGRIAEGAVASIHVRAGIGGPPSAHWEIQGDEGVLRISCAGYLHWRPLTVEFCARGATSWIPLDLGPSTTLSSSDYEGPSTHVALAYEAFAESIQKDAESIPDFTVALARHRLIDAVARAAYSGQTQHIAQPGSGTAG